MFPVQIALRLPCVAKGEVGCESVVEIVNRHFSTAGGFVNHQLFNPHTKSTTDLLVLY
jgi:hypothetical protein